MSLSTYHTLEGLEPDNLQAFLALVGLLRALETARPEWRPRAYWNVERRPLRPVLVLAESVSRDTMTDFALAGIKAWGSSLGNLAARVLDIENVNTDRNLERLTNLVSSSETLHQLDLIKLPRMEQEMLECLCCEYAPPKGVLKARQAASGVSSNAVASTNLKFCSGQMAFVGTMLAVTGADNLSALALSSSLFESWTYRQKGLSLRLSPAEAKRYALQAADPSPQGAWSEQGATALSVLGFPAYAMTIGKGRASTVGIHRSVTGFNVRWPIWSSSSQRGWSLAGIEVVLRHRNLAGNRSHPPLSRGLRQRDRGMG